MFTTIDPNEYYKPILVRTAFRNNYSEYEIRGDKDKNKSMQHYLYTIILPLENLINERKNKIQNEQKVQLTIAVKFNHTTDPSKTQIFYVKSKSMVIRHTESTDDNINKIFDSILENYEREADIFRNRSNYSFECVDLAIVQFHDMKLKRGSCYYYYHYYYDFIIFIQVGRISKKV